MKKKIFISISVIIIMLLSVSTYTYINEQQLSHYIEESNVLKKKVLILSDLRTDLVKCSQVQRLYILTGKKEYKNQFDNNIKEIYKVIDDMYKEGYLSVTEKKKLNYTINNFNNLSKDYFIKNHTNYISSQLENELVNYNKEQLKVLNNITLDISSQSDDIAKENDKINLLYSTQSKLVQGVSSSIAVIISGFLYYFKVRLKKDNIDIDDIINYLSKDEKEDLREVKEIEDLNLFKLKIAENELLLDNAKLLYMESLKLKDQCEKSEIILAQIDASVKTFKSLLDDIDNYPDVAQKIILNDIENQLLNLKILFKSLPYYNEFIMDISKNMIFKDKN